MSNRAYSAYGLRFESEIACPGLPLDLQTNGNPDVTIRLLPPVADISESLEKGYYQVRPGSFCLAIKGVGRYLVEDGSRISIEPMTGSSADEVRLFLMGSVMGALLYQRGLFPLHGSAVETRWGAMVFVGAQGAGKSTLAAQFLRRGYRLLSDDVCAVTAAHGAIEILPALAQFRLRADAYERFDAPCDARFHVDKFVVSMKDGYCPDPAPLKAIHVLADGEDGEPRFEILRGFDRVQRLLENLYRPQFLAGQGTQRDLMRLAAEIAREVQVVAVFRKRDPERIDALVNFLEAAWTKHYGSKCKG